MTRTQDGFSLIEMLVVVLVFTVISGAAFLALDVFQQRYRAENELLDAFQGARLAIDQITRDVHSAGYPPSNVLATDALAANSTLVSATPFAWAPGYPGTPCSAGTCTSPGDFDLIIETDIDPENNNGVEWVRYRLVDDVLERGVASKVLGGDPLAATAPNMITYVENVVNNADAAEMAFLQGFYNNLFPGNNPVPLFTYQFTPGTTTTPPDIREVTITMLVRSAGLDPKTQQPRVVTLTAHARRINPN